MSETVNPDDIARQRAKASRDGHERLTKRLADDRLNLRALRDAKSEPATLKKMERIIEQGQMQMVQFLAQAEAFERILRGEP